MQTGFFSIGAGHDSRYYRAHDTIPREEYLQMLRTGCRGYHKTVFVSIGQGNEAGDLLATFGPIFFVSDRVLQVFDENGFRRYEAFPVEVVGWQGEPLPRYHGISFHGRGGPLLEDESGCVWSLHADGTRTLMRTEHGLVFDTGKWDGSDLFYLDERPGTRIVTARVKHAFERAGITNYGLVPLEDYLNLSKARNRLAGLDDEA